MKSLANILLARCSALISGKRLTTASVPSVEELTQFKQIITNFLFEAESCFSNDETYQTEKCVVLKLCSFLRGHCSLKKLLMFVLPNAKQDSLEQSKFQSLFSQFKLYTIRWATYLKASDRDLHDQAAKTILTLHNKNVVSFTTLTEVVADLLETSSFDVLLTEKRTHIENIYFSTLRHDVSDILNDIMLLLDAAFSSTTKQFPTFDFERVHEKQTQLDAVREIFLKNGLFFYLEQFTLKSSFRSLRKLLYKDLTLVPEKSKQDPSFGLDQEINQFKLLEYKKKLYKEENTKTFENAFELIASTSSQEHTRKFYLVSRESKLPCDLTVWSTSKDPKFFNDKVLPIFMKKLNALEPQHSKEKANAKKHSCYAVFYLRLNGKVYTWKLKQTEASQRITWALVPLKPPNRLLVPFMFSSCASYLSEVAFENVENSVIEMKPSHPLTKLLITANGFTKQTMQRTIYTFSDRETELARILRSDPQLLFNEEEETFSCPAKTFILLHTSDLPLECFE